MYASWTCSWIHYGLVWGNLAIHTRTKWYLQDSTQRWGTVQLNKLYLFWSIPGSTQYCEGKCWAPMSLISWSVFCTYVVGCNVVRVRTWLLTTQYRGVYHIKAPSSRYMQKIHTAPRCCDYCDSCTGRRQFRALLALECIECLEYNTGGQQACQITMCFKWDELESPSNDFAIWSLKLLKTDLGKIGMYYCN